MRKKQKYSNFFGDNDFNPFYFLVVGGAVIYIASKGVGKITTSKNTLTNTALVIGGLIVYAKIKANQPED
tara:strand:- start:36 stop:245 length:210 start_codon:yes stop_codon:yes gene_type:complete